MARSAILPGFPFPIYLVELGDRAAILPGVFVIEQGAIHGTGAATIPAPALAGTVKVIVTAQL